MLENIFEHTVETSLLNDGACIDAGCLGFQFSIAMRDRGCKVFAFDIQDMEAPNGINFQCEAVTNLKYSEIKGLRYKTGPDKQAYYLSEVGNKTTHSIWINNIYRWIKYGVDCLKLDVEGSEYHILSENCFDPIPQQISVEFHMHCHRQLHDKHYGKCMENLLKYYVPVQHELTERHGAGLNYWDSLFIRKDLC